MTERERCVESLKRAYARNPDELGYAYNAFLFARENSADGDRLHRRMSASNDVGEALVQWWRLVADPIETQTEGRA